MHTLCSIPISHSHTHISHEGGGHAEVRSNGCEVEWSHTGNKSLQSSILYTVPHIGRVMLWLNLKSSEKKNKTATNFEYSCVKIQNTEMDTQLADCIEYLMLQ